MIRFPDLAATLLDLQNRDLRLRDELLASGQLTEGYHPEMEALHRENTTALKSIFDKIGYPTRNKVGEAASEAAWLVIQHSIGDPVFMRECEKLLTEAVEANETDPRQLAYLSDRISMFEGKPQRFGTQFDWDEGGRMHPCAYDDLKAVNERRAAIGLNTLEEQTAIMQERTKGQPPPRDFAERRRVYDAWRRRVGWIE